MATTLQPSTNSELQLYRGLQRANLLQYFDTFITQGGDDVQQLCEAGEDEFLEIMALVGMASKPLHVRRLQKALQEWLANPTAFDVPKKFPTIVMSMVGNGGGVSNAGRPGSTPSPLSSTEASLSPAHSVPSSIVDTQQQNLLVRGANSTSTSSSTLANIGSTNQTESVKLTANQQLQHMSAQVLNSSLNISARLSTSSPSGSLMTSLNSDQSPPWALQTRGPTPPGGSASLTSGVRRGRQGHVDIASSEQPMTSSDQPSPPDSPQEFKDVIKDGVYNPNDAAYIPTVSHPTLMDHQISAIAAAAAILARDLPPIEPKSLPKKQNSKDITTVMMMTSDDPNRLDAMRKYAAIYGRFDSKRKNHRPMSLHEISVNEAAAQLCHHFPALLTRREELFPLARQVVRDSGYQYSKGHSRAAEVLVQPKLEPLDHQQMTASVPALSQSSQLTTFVSGVASSEEDAYIELQNELGHVTRSLSEMDKEQARIRAALRVLLEANDLDQARGLTAEMDVLNDRQEALAKRRHRVVSAMARYKKGGLRPSGTSDRSNLSSKQHTSKQGTKKNFSIITSSKSNTNANKLASNSHNIYGTNLSMSNNGAGSGIYNSSSNNNNNTIGEAEVTTSTNPLNTLYLAAMQNQRDSLFEEGLRIATQYGMSDLAKEIMGMKTQTKAIQSEDSATVSLASSYPPANTTHSQTCSSTDIKTAPSSSSLITSFSSSSSVATSAAVTVSSDNISASSTEYLALGSGCWTHSPPTVNTSTVSSSSSPASLLFPSSVSVIASKPGKSITQPPANPTLPPSSSKSPKLTSPSSTAPTSTPCSTAVSTTSPTTQTSQSQTGKVSINTAISTPASSHYQQSSTTTTTTATKSGQTVEIEPRRSSRRRNGEPDYYLINGGEKRFRANLSGSTSASSPSGRRGSSNDRRKCAAAPPDFHPSISSPSKPYTLEPCNNNNNNSKNNNTIKGNGKNSKGNNSVDSTTMRLDMNEIRFRNPAAEIHKVRMGFQQRFEPLDRDKR